MKSSQILERARELQLIHATKGDVLFHGYSMFPLLIEGDEVTVEPVEFCEIRTGNIIVSYDEAKYPARRVLYKKSHSLVVWRDNWSHREVLEIREKDILGRLTGRRRNGELLTENDYFWKVMTLWAYVRFGFGHLFYRIPPLRVMVEKRYQKRWRNL